jgi:nickel transport protein
MSRRAAQLSFILTIFAGIVLAAPAMAHRVSVFAYVSNGMVYSEGYFPDGKPVVNGDIEVFDSKKQNLLQGKTDQEGRFSFPVPAKDNLTIVINAAMGHRSEFLLNKNEL